MPLPEVTIEWKHLKMYRVEIEGDSTGAYETPSRWEAEGYYQAATEWNQKHGLKRRIRLVVMRGNTLDEVIHDTRDNAILTGSREWEEDETGEPVRITPKHINRK